MPDHAFERVVLVLCAGTLFLIGWAVWAKALAPTIALNAKDWECSRSEATTHLQPLRAGEATTLLPVSSAKCVEYKRRQH